MTQTALKRELHKAIDTIDDDALLEAVYTILHRKISPSYELTDEDIQILEEREALYKAGKTKMFTSKEVRKKILKKLGK